MPLGRSGTEMSYGEWEVKLITLEGSLSDSTSAFADLGSLHRI